MKKCPGKSWKLMIFRKLKFIGISGLQQVREYLETLEKSGNRKKRCRKSGNFTNFVIYQRKVREKCPTIYLDVKFPKIKCSFCQLTLSLLKAIWELQRVGQGKFIKKIRENLEKSGNFEVKMMWQPSLCIIKHCIERAKNWGVKFNFCRGAHKYIWA